MKLDSVLPAAAVLATLAAAPPAAAQYFTNADGYAPDGKWRVQVELDPYLWIPGLEGSASYGKFRDRDVSISSAVPSVGDLTAHLHFSFMGYGEVRYGPLIASVDTQYVSASGTKHYSIDPAQHPLLAAANGGAPLGITASGDLFRIAPGFGGELLKGSIAAIPAELDAQVGFAYFSSGVSLSTHRDIFGGADLGGDFVQPWAGLRARFYPSPKWRIDLSALGQGFGVNGGSWGWGAGAMVSYAFNDWLSGTLGFRALSSERTGNRNDSNYLKITAYGPLLGIGFRF